MIDTRSNSNNQQNGVITVMLRDAAMVVSQNPTALCSLEINISGDNKILVKKNVRN